MRHLSQLTAVLGIALGVHSVTAAEIRAVWPDTPPGPVQELPPEVDTTDEGSRTVAGRRVRRLTNVTRPTLEFFRPSADLDTGAAVVICPGGAHRILAYDLEGTEVAQWLQSIGVTGIVLKYRVPAPNPDQKWEAAVQDAQRAVSLVRSQAASGKMDPGRIGILGFSAGGQTAAYTCLMDQRQYPTQDNVDSISHRPDFGILIYPAYLADDTNQALVPEATVTPGTPPLFMVHAYDDPVSVTNSLLLYLALRQADVPAEIHAFASGGHGFGLRPTHEPCSRWPELCRQWLTRHGWLNRSE